MSDVKSLADEVDVEAILTVQHTLFVALVIGNETTRLADDIA